MKNLKTYKIFESSQELTPEQIEWLDSCTKGTWTLNPQTGLVDVKGDFDCSAEGLTDFKGVKFGSIEDTFNCRANNLTSLDGAPQKVGADFYCDYNQLTSLVGAPQKVGESFYCDHNRLTSLKGSPQKVGWNFRCENNQLTSLEGAPQKVGGNFFCDHNQLTSLVGTPQKFDGSFSCNNNQITSLEGAPQKAVYLYCDDNPVSARILKSIFFLMRKGGSYIQAVKSLWNEIPLENQALLYRPEFEWVSPEEIRKLEALRAYQGFKGMI